VRAVRRLVTQSLDQVRSPVPASGDGDGTCGHLTKEGEPDTQVVPTEPVWSTAALVQPCTVRNPTDAPLPSPAVHDGRTPKYEALSPTSWPHPLASAHSCGVRARRAGLPPATRSWPRWRSWRAWLRCVCPPTTHPPLEEGLAPTTHPAGCGRRYYPHPDGGGGDAICTVAGAAGQAAAGAADAGAVRADDQRGGHRRGGVRVDTHRAHASAACATGPYAGCVLVAPRLATRERASSALQRTRLPHFRDRGGGVSQTVGRRRRRAAGATTMMRVRVGARTRGGRRPPCAFCSPCRNRRAPWVLRACCPRRRTRRRLTSPRPKSSPPPPPTLPPARKPTRPRACVAAPRASRLAGAT